MLQWAIPEKNRKNPKKWGVEDILFWKKKPGIFTFVTLTLEISEKKRFQLQKCFEIMWHPLEIPRSKTKTHGNSAWFFPDHPWKLDFFFNWPPEFSHVPYSVLLELPYPQPSPPHLDFIWSSPILNSSPMQHQRWSSLWQKMLQADCCYIQLLYYVIELLDLTLKCIDEFKLRQ